MRIISPLQFIRQLFLSIRQERQATFNYHHRANHHLCTDSDGLLACSLLHQTFKHSNTRQWRQPGRSHSTRVAQYSFQTQATIINDADCQPIQRRESLRQSMQVLTKASATLQSSYCMISPVQHSDKSCVKSHFHLDDFGKGVFEKQDVVDMSSLAQTEKPWLFMGRELMHRQRGFNHPAGTNTAI